MFNKEIKEEISELRRQIERLRSDIQRGSANSTGAGTFSPEDRDALQRILAISEKTASRDYDLDELRMHLKDFEQYLERMQHDLRNVIEESIRHQLHPIMDSSFQQHEQLRAMFDDALQRLAAETKSAEGAIQDYSRRLERYENDFYYKLQSPLLMELIKIADRLEILSKKPGLREEDAEDIRREFEAVKGVLYNFKVKSYQSSEGAPFDENIQECVDTTITDDPGKNATIAESIRSGYVWSLPLVNSFSADSSERNRVIMREEQVRIYVYHEN